MKLQQLYKGTLINRYKRFITDIILDKGETITAACPNTGSMLSCSEPGSQVLVSKSDNPNRKYTYTWELIWVNHCWVCINTHIPNKLIYSALKENKIQELNGYKEILREVKYGENSRIDFLLRNEKRLCYVEVKNVTLVQEGIAYFPDAITSRGTKHLNELLSMIYQGHRAVMLYLVQRSDAKLFKPARDIDKIYAETLIKVAQQGVEILVYQSNVTKKFINLGKKLPFEL